MTYKVTTKELQWRNCIYYIDAESPEEIENSKYHLLVCPEDDDFASLEDINILKIKKIHE